MNVIAADGVSPRAASRRATGTEPHSQMGKATPAMAAAGSWSALGSPASRSRAVTGTKTSIAAEARAPSNTNGMA